VTAVRTVFRLVEARQRLSRDPRQNAVLRLQHGDVLAELGQHRCCLQADITAADHHDAGDIGKFGDHPIDIGPVADAMYPGEVVPRTHQPPRRPPGRPDERAVVDPAVVAERHLMRDRIDRDDRAPEQQCHVALPPETRRADQQPFERLVARQITLRQRRPFIGRVRLVAEQGYAALVAPLAQRDRRLRAGMARAGDEDVVTERGSGHPDASSSGSRPRSTR
jgi:hypothetical protein